MKYLIYRHKSILIAIISLVVLWGCSKTEVDTPTLPEDKLYFNAKLDGRGDEQLTTRAYINDIDFATRGFTVAGYRTKGEFSTSNPNSLPFPNVFDYLNPGVSDAVINVKKDAGELTNRQYWVALPRLPLSNIYSISYFAWSSSQDNTITAATSTANDKGAPWIEAKVGGANTPQPDIVGALSMNHSNEYTVSAIDLDFKHLLSKMSFLVKTSNGMTANITKVECVYGASAVYSQARFTFDGTAEIGLWSNFNNYIGAGAVTPTNWNSPVTTATSALLGSMTFIPQSLSDDALSLNITYTTTQGGAISSETTRNVRLKAIEMKPGKNYVYTLDVDANKISVFNVKVEGWIEMLGTDKGLPLVPGAMDPNVLLLLEGTDPPYTTADGSRYWLDRSGWNNHCQIIDKNLYNGTGAFDITHDATKRGYVFNRAAHLSGFIYNHIRIPYLGALTGNIGCEIVCHNLSPTAGWNWPTPLCISQGERTFGELSTMGRALLVHINENNKNGWDYANQTDINLNAGGERVTLTAPSGYNWNKLSFYGYGRINGVQSFSVIDNTNSASSTVSSNATSYPLKHGMIGAVFNGIINYVKITNKSINFEQMMDDYKILAKKYYIKTEQGAYVPPVKDGLLACWDARSGLLQGSSNGNGAYWMDQSGNNYFLKAVVPSGVNGSFAYDASKKAIRSNTPVFDKPGIYMELNNGIEGQYSAITIETVSQTITPRLNFFMELYDKNGNRIAWIRPNTGDAVSSVNNYGVELGTTSLAGTRLMGYYNRDYLSNYIYSRRSLVYVINFKDKKLKAYLNGNILTSQEGYQEVSISGTPESVDIARIVLFNQNNGDGFNLKQAYDGYVHTFRIYGRELNQSEIQTNLARDKSDFAF